MLYFVIERKKKYALFNPVFFLCFDVLVCLFYRTSLEWNQVANSVKPGGNFVLLELEPAVWYHLRVTAHNNAGFNVAEYEFATLTVTGGKFFYYFVSFLFSLRMRSCYQCFPRQHLLQYERQFTSKTSLFTF